jgi:two-component system sensor histidine kinase KdpD
LRQADAVKTALLHSVSHDLRTPLAAIRAAAESLSEPAAAWTEEQRYGFVVALHRNVDRLDRLVGDLLDMSRIEAGMVPLDRQYYALADLIDEVLGTLTPRLGDRLVEVDAPAALPLVAVDAGAMHRVLTNLVGNALDYCPPHAPLTITATQDGDVLKVSVQDRGPGLPPSALPHVFDKFYRVVPTAPGASRHAGLGLAIAKGLVEAHGGQIRAENRPTGGLCVSFTLPIVPPRTAVAAAAGEAGRL